MRFSGSTHLQMCLSLETSTCIIRTGLPILVELIGLVNSVIISLSQMTLLRWLTFLLGFQTVILIVLLFWISFFLLMLVFVLLRSQAVILIVLLFWIYLFLLMLVFVLQWLSLHWEILIMLLSQFPSTFHQIHNRTAPASAAASKFCEWVQVGIDVYIPHQKYQVKPHSSP